MRPKPPRASDAALTRSPLAQAALAAALTAILYIPGLAASPPHLLHDEIKFALQAKAIADTGRDLNGRMLAVYFPEPGYSAGRDPVCIYLTAGVLAFLPLDERAIRLPSALVGALGVGVIFLVAHRLFERSSLAWVAAGLLALMPIYYIHSRQALSVIYPVPFVLLWLLALQRHLESPRPASAVVCGTVLGLGVYSYLASVVMMPLYLGVTVIVLAVRREWRHAVAAIVAFAVTLVPIGLWHFAQPDRYADIATAYHLFEGGPAGPVSASAALSAFAEVVRQRIDVYWDSFNPSRLFFTGESSLHISTREIGSFLLPMAVWLPVGLYVLARERRSLFGAVLLAGVLTAPLPGVIMADVEIRRWLVVTPFAAIVATVGIDRLLGGGRLASVICWLLLACVPLQAVFFARDYFGPYRERASFWFGGNIRAAMGATLDDVGDGNDAAVYIDNDIPWVEAYWRFYATARHRQALIPHAHYMRFDIDGPPQPSPDARAVVSAQNTAAALALERAGWTARHRVADIDGKPGFVIYGPAGA